MQVHWKVKSSGVQSFCEVSPEHKVEQVEYCPEHQFALVVREIELGSSVEFCPWTAQAKKATAARRSLKLNMATANFESRESRRGVDDVDKVADFGAAMDGESMYAELMYAEATCAEPMYGRTDVRRTDGRKVMK